VRAHFGRQRLDMIAGIRAQDLLRLLLHLLFFAADVRNHIGVDIPRSLVPVNIHLTAWYYQLALWYIEL